MPKVDAQLAARAALRVREEALDALKERRRADDARGRTDALRTELAAVARVADPILRAWVRSDRFGSR